MPYKPRHRLSPQQVELRDDLKVAVAPRVGAKVIHPLWPELGAVRWSTGQVSTHNLSTLREVEG